MSSVPRPRVRLKTIASLWITLPLLNCKSFRTSRAAKRTRRCTVYKSRSRGLEPTNYATPSHREIDLQGRQDFRTLQRQALEPLYGFFRIADHQKAGGERAKRGRVRVQFRAQCRGGSR